VKRAGTAVTEQLHHQVGTGLAGISTIGSMPEQTSKPPQDEAQNEAGLDTRHAHSARVYNYWLGGKDNFAADREAAEQAIAANARALLTSTREGATAYLDADLRDPAAIVRAASARKP
jgi:hypothetical protein